MKQPKELRDEFVNEHKELMSQDQIVSSMQTIIEFLRTADITTLNGDELSRAALKLSTLLVNLGMEVSDAELMANAAYLYRKWKKAGHINRLIAESASFTRATSLADEASTKEVEEELEYRYHADFLRALYDDAERLVSVMQSRLRFLTNEEIRSQAS